MILLVDDLLAIAGFLCRQIAGCRMGVYIGGDHRVSWVMGKQKLMVVRYGHPNQGVA